MWLYYLCDAFEGKGVDGKINSKKDLKIFGGNKKALNFASLLEGGQRRGRVGRKKVKKAHKKFGKVKKVHNFALPNGTEVWEKRKEKWRA